MHKSLIDPSEPIERQNARLMAIVSALMRRVEQDMDEAGAAYAQFERAVLLEDQVRSRTQELEQALELLNRANASLADANREIEGARADLSAAIEAVREGFALFGPDNILIMCNSRFAQQMPDVKARAVPGLSFDDNVKIVSQSPSLSVPEGMSRQTWAERRMRRHADNHVMFNVQLVRDHWLQVSEHRTPNGGTVMLQTDITDVIRAGREEREKLLDEQARMIRATLEHLNQGVTIFDRKARLVGWNTRARTLLGLSPHEMPMGQQFERLARQLRAKFAVSHDAGLRILESWIGDVAQQRPVSFTLTGDDRYTLDTFARQMPDGGFVISFTDVTAERESTRALAQANETLEQRVMDRTMELEDALDAAERANASKSRFVAAASHDLLQPLSAAKLYLASIPAGPNSEVVGKAERALVSVETIIEALLDISKLDSGAAIFDVREVSLNDILRRLRDEFAPMAALKSLDLRIVGTKAMVMSDPTYLRRILQNLIGNALRYTASGKVLVGARHNGGAVRLEVWDTGPGIAEDDQQAIFQEFHRLDKRASASEGMGLGLAIVERACAGLGHPLELWSVPGEGTGFFLTMPLAGTGALTNGQRQPVSRSTLWFSGLGLIVLLVENDADLRRAMTVLLGKWDVNVLGVAGGDEAVQLLEEIEIAPDAMLIDYQLDNGEVGTDLAGRLRARFGPVPTCILSANRSAELREACDASGLLLISKPIDAARLESFLATVSPGQV